MSEVHDYAAAATLALRASAQHIEVVRNTLPARPGLYAIHGDRAAWLELNLDHRPGIPLYVGKSERNLASRDLGTHFAIHSEHAAKTGSSTLRRSLAALLREPLDLRAVPRNPARPGHFDKYGLDLKSEGRLSQWMRENLRLVFWVAPANLPVRLGEVEKLVITASHPPLNLAGVGTPLSQLVAARKRMSAAAAAWEAE